jgi:calcineurin-like phosphoesterase family protein/ankyrin repeat protein
MTLMKIAAKQLTTIGLTMVLLIMTAGVLIANTIQSSSQQFESEEPHSDNFTEGPHVFYKRGKVTVKNVHFSSLGETLEEQSFKSKKDVPSLTCTVDNSEKTQFTIKLTSDYKSPPSEFPQPNKLFAISDIEGHFEAFEKTLRGNGVINKNLDWSYGNGHLVLVGDFFDRGYNVTPVLWLIYKLEQQAAKAGGMVHFIIGNHEEMNMRGDLRYVKDRYIRAAKVMKSSYRGLYSNDTELGRWLRSKNIIEKIGETIFVHGGLSPQMAASRIRLEEMNDYARSYYGTDAWRLEQKGGTAAAVFSKEGPLWYRGYFIEKLDQKTIDQTLDLYGAKYVVVGHTIVPNISSLYEGRVIAIDVKHDVALFNQSSNSLLFEDDIIYAVNVNGKKSYIEFFMTEEIVVSAFNAIKVGNINAIKEFIKSGDRVNKHFFNSRVTMLQAAIQNDQPDVVQFLIDQGADIELLSENMTPLMHAIQVNNQLIMDLLIEKGANINALNLQKKSPLFYCAKNGNIEMAKILVDHGAKIELKDGRGRTAAEYALKNDNKPVAIFLQSCKN